MSFLPRKPADPLTALVYRNDPAARGFYNIFKKPAGPPPPPGPPNPNDAANAAQQTTDQMRMRRGMLANIFAGATNQQPVTGKTQLGT